ncbi:MAG: glycosyltransferase [Clostridia bacterium]|nr:glycosyltransferase [Clostridia bacterium]
MKFDYTDITEKAITKSDKLIEMKTIISIITPFYNAKKYLDDTAKCIINQTFPFFEWLIVDDGSTDEESLKYLEKIGCMDSRIKILHKENSGQAHTRDFGVEHCCKESKYVMFIDDDDIIDDTYLECAYWTLETNKGASWAFTDVIHFGELNALATTRFDPEREKKENNIVVTALIKKADFLKVGGFGIKEKGIYEDWNLWLKMIAAEMYPVRMDFFGFWYRRKEKKESELAASNKNQIRAKEIIDETAKSIKKTKPAVQYPKSDYNWDIIEECVDGIITPKYEDNNKTRILMIIPWMVIGGADKFNIDLINGLDKDKFEVTIISTEPNYNPWREKYVKNTRAIYDLTTFLDRKYWLAFINYIIEKNNINLVFNTNSTFGYSILPYIKSKHQNIPIVDYIHMEEWYNRNGGFSRDSAFVASVIDKTFVCNENSKNILVNHFGRKKSEIETIYIGVDEKKFNPGELDKVKLREKYRIPEGKKVIGFIARIDLQKRPILLMEILKKLKKNRSDFLVVVAGDGPMLREIERRSKKYKLEKNVKFLGAVSNTKEIYAISDITLNCSIKEGLALTAYESLSMGVPVVSAGVGGQAELINDEVGVIVPCYQEEKDVEKFDYSDEEINNYVVAIEKVFSNIDSYKSKSRDRILNGFTINHMIEKMSTSLEYIAKNPNKQKIENGIGLSNCLDICKELNTKYLIAFEGQYQWGVQQTNNQIDREVERIYKVNVCKQEESNSNGSNNKESVSQKIKREGKRAILKKICIKLHIFHESEVIYNILKNIKIIFKSVIKVVMLVLKLAMMICIRAINVPLKLLKIKPINLFDEDK